MTSSYMPGLILYFSWNPFLRKQRGYAPIKWNGKSRKRTETRDLGNSQCKKKRKAKEVLGWWQNGLKTMAVQRVQRASDSGWGKMAVFKRDTSKEQTIWKLTWEVLKEWMRGMWLLQRTKKWWQLFKKKLQSKI